MKRSHVKDSQNDAKVNRALVNQINNLQSIIAFIIIHPVRSIFNDKLSQVQKRNAQKSLTTCTFIHEFRIYIAIWSLFSYIHFRQMNARLPINQVHLLRPGIITCTFLAQIKGCPILYLQLLFIHSFIKQNLWLQVKPV